MRILVTGGFGFLGSHLLEQILVEDPHHDVHVIDNLSTPAVDPNVFLAGRVKWRADSVQGYLNDWDGKKPFDRIYHLASVVGPAGILPHVGRIVRSIVDDTYALADAAKRWDARLLDVSTSEVYGGGQEGYCSETMPKIVPAHTSVRLEYAVAKLAAETALLNLATVGTLDCVIVRPFNIAGPRQSGAGGFVLPRFVRAALDGTPLTVFGDGMQIRAFTHARDVARGLTAVMERGRTGEAYNIGNPDNRTTILDLANRVVTLADSRSPVEFVDPKTLYGPLYEEANDKYPDARKAQRELGWAPELGLDATILDTLTWTRTQVAA